MKNIYKNHKPDPKMIAIVKYSINRNKGIISDDLIKSCLKQVDKISSEKQNLYLRRYYYEHWKKP